MVSLRQLAFIAAKTALLAVPAWAEMPFLRDGTAGFVVSEFSYALGPDGSEPGVCPDGMSKNLMEIYAHRTNAQPHPGETEEAFSQRLHASARTLGKSEDGKDLCLHPEDGPPEPFFQTVASNDLPVEGIDLDGRSGIGDFQAGVDNQFYRLVGCSRSYQSTGQSNEFAIEMLSGSWGILIELSGVDDLQNDEEVVVTISANADPIQLSAAREPLPYATYAKDQDPRFRASTRGRIENGLLTTEPVDVRFHSVVNSMQLERPLNKARLHASVSAEGELKGYLAGYTDIEELYDFSYGYRNGKTDSGELSPLRGPSANGAAFVLGHTCHGAWQALHRLADALPDPETGRNTALSTQYRFSAIPAFVVDIATESKNAKVKQTDLFPEGRNEY